MFLVSRMALETSLNAVKGGQTTMSTSFTLAVSIFKSFTRSSASATVLFIFQFPAIISFRSLFIIKFLQFCDGFEQCFGYFSSFSGVEFNGVTMFRCGLEHD